MITRLVPNLRIVVLESPYDTLSDPLVQDLFSRTMKLKIEGYQTVYPYGVLPVDSYDFIATHQLVCREKNGRYEILMGAKYVTLQKCMTHRLPFPGLSLLRSSAATPHAQILESLLERYSKNPEKVSYGSSWTIDPISRSNPVVKKTLKDLMTATLVHYETELETVERFCCGAPKIKTDLYFENLGYHRLSDQNNPLPAFNQASLMGEAAVMLRCSNFSDAALNIAESYRDLWESRLVLRPESVAQQSQEAA
jgi:hypothetical protein